MALLINDEYVHDDVFFAEFRHLGGSSIQHTQPGSQHEIATLRQLAEERVVHFVLLRQRARAAGITVTSEEVGSRRQQQGGTSSASVYGDGVLRALADHLLVEKYCAWATRHEPRPSRSDVETFYRTHPERFHLPERVRVQQVIRNIGLPEEEPAARAELEQAEQELAAGNPFRQVAERHSDCGGKIDLGWVARGEMVPAFEDAVFALDKGQRSTIFRTVFGLHLASVLERRAAGLRSFDEARTTLARELHDTRKQQRIQLEIADALRHSTITVAPAPSQTERAS